MEAIKLQNSLRLEDKAKILKAIIEDGERISEIIKQILGSLVILEINKTYADYSENTLERVKKYLSDVHSIATYAIVMRYTDQLNINAKDAIENAWDLFSKIYTNAIKNETEKYMNNKAVEVDVESEEYEEEENKEQDVDVVDSGSDVVDTYATTNSSYQNDQEQEEYNSVSKYELIQIEESISNIFANNDDFFSQFKKLYGEQKTQNILSLIKVIENANSEQINNYIDYAYEGVQILQNTAKAIERTYRLEISYQENIILLYWLQTCSADIFNKKIKLQAKTNEKNKKITTIYQMLYEIDRNTLFVVAEKTEDVKEYIIDDIYTLTNINNTGEIYTEEIDKISDLVQNNKINKDYAALFLKNENIRENAIEIICITPKKVLDLFLPVLLHCYILYRYYQEYEKAKTCIDEIKKAISLYKKYTKNISEAIKNETNKKVSQVLKAIYVGDEENIVNIMSIIQDKDTIDQIFIKNKNIVELSIEQYDDDDNNNDAEKTQIYQGMSGNVSNLKKKKHKPIPIVIDSEYDVLSHEN